MTNVVTFFHGYSFAYIGRINSNLGFSIQSFTPDMRQSKTLILSTNVDQNMLETELLIVIGLN